MENQRGPVPEEDTREFWRWKFQRQSECISAVNNELSAVMAQLKSENRDLTETKQTQAMQLTRLCAELEDCKIKSAEERSESAKNLAEIDKQKSLKTKEEFAKVKSAFEKEVAEKEDYRKKLTKIQILKKLEVAKVQSELEKETAQRESKQNELSQRLQEVQEVASRTISERDRTIAELRMSNKEKLEQLEQARVKHLRDVAATRQSVEMGKESQIAKLKCDIEDLNDKLKEQKSKMVRKNMTISTLEKQTQDLTQTVVSKDEHLRIQAKEKKQVRKQLDDEERLGVKMEMKLEMLTKDIKKLQQENKELNEQQKSSKAQMLLLKDEKKGLNPKWQTLNQKMLSVQLLLNNEKGKYKELARRQRELVAGLDGCREVLADPRALKAKMVALIAAHVEGDANVHVDQDTLNLNETMSQIIREQAQHHDSVVSHHKREIEHATAAARNAEVRADREKMALVKHINDHRMEAKKSMKKQK